MDIVLEAWASTVYVEEENPEDQWRSVIGGGLSELMSCGAYVYQVTDLLVFTQKEHRWWLRLEERMEDQVFFEVATTIWCQQPVFSSIIHKKWWIKNIENIKIHFAVGNLI